MNFRDINSASQNLRRNVQDINLAPENRAILEKVMVALAASGRVQEMALIAQTLEKTSVNADLTGAIHKLTQLVSTMTPQPQPTQEVHQHDTNNALVTG